ncbi:hypothetical protein AK88_02331 [Plasmodium fragile]|uniref:RNA-binding S4 domain-containing protein n=1 Tax=Plasmodium fragile TaxID=5857 RepID=A0A0D9QQU1_PLAFR|nr:uncharacterized protein AK88_02331 [Plasmodium fragile]KJP88056.1 hypothetical protein AK88_02331 [Plasmodium fragile]
MDEFETTKGFSNFPLGQEVLLDKVLNEQRYEHDKGRKENKKKKKKGENIQEQLHYYLNEKYESFIGYDNFMNTLFKKKKVLRVTHGRRDDRRKRKEEHARREGVRPTGVAPSDEDATKVKCRGESASSDGPGSDIRSSNGRGKKKNMLEAQHKGGNSKTFNSASSLKRCTCDCHQCRSPLMETDPGDGLTDESDGRLTEESSDACPSPPHYSDASDISNLSPDAFCFEKQFKYIYDLYKQNDKNVYLFYNPPMCKCVNKSLKEKYYRNLCRKYPCLFNCTLEGEEGAGKPNRGEEEQRNGQLSRTGGVSDTGGLPHSGEEPSDVKRLTYAEVASDAVEMKLYAKAFFELCLLQGAGGGSSGMNAPSGDEAKKVSSDAPRDDSIEDATQQGEDAPLGAQEEEMLKRFFNKCLLRIMRRKSPTCENNSCCGLLYVPYSYIVVLLNRKIENLSYLCSNLNLPSSTDMYYNNKRNIVTICTKNSVHEFFSYYSLRENCYVKNLLIYDVFFHGFIPFFKPLLNLKVKKNLDKVMNYVNYNKGCNLSVVFFWSGVARETESPSQGVCGSGGGSSGSGRSSSCSGGDSDADEGKRRIQTSNMMHLRVCKIININHPNEYKGMTSEHPKKDYTTEGTASRERKDKMNADQQYFANLCNGSEVINNINIKMVVEKIIEIASRNESSLCEHKCVFNRYNQMHGKKKKIQIYLCESINSFAFDRRPLYIKRREVTLSSFVHFHNIMNTYLGVSRNSLDVLIGRRMEEDVFDMNLRRDKLLSSCHVKKEGREGGEVGQMGEAGQATETNGEVEEGQTSNNVGTAANPPNIDHLFNETLFFFNDNSDLYTYEEYKKAKLQSVGRAGDQDNKPTGEQQNAAAGKTWMARSATHAQGENIWDSLCTQYAQNLFNIYVCSFLTKQNSCKRVASSVGKKKKKKKKKLENKMSYQEKISFIKKCYCHLFRFYKDKFRISLKKEEEDMLHKNNWASEDALISHVGEGTMPSQLLRLSKILSMSAVTSRGKAQELIKNGKVKVNNQVVRQNVVVDINSFIELEGKPVLVDVTTKLWGIYKPKHVFCSSERNYVYEEKKRAEVLKDDAHNGLVTGRRLLPKGSYSTAQLAPGDRRKGFLLTGREHISEVGRSDSYEGHSGEVAQTLRQLKWTRDIVVKRPASSSEVGTKQDELEKFSQSAPQKLNTNLFDYLRKMNKTYETKNNNITNDIPEHLIVVNSLSASSEGLVLLTNDGDLARNLKDIQNNIVTTYIVKVKEELTNEKIKLIEKGCRVGDVHIQPLEVHVIKPHCSSPKWIKITYVEKSHTHLDVLFCKYGLTVRKCKRFSFGPYKVSDLSMNFLTPLKIHSTLSDLVPKYPPKLILAQPTGNVLTDEHNRFVLVKDYLKNSVIRGQASVQQSGTDEDKVVKCEVVEGERR